MNTCTLTVRLPREEYMRLKVVAKDRDKSLNRVVLEAILADLDSSTPARRQWRIPVVDTPPTTAISEGWDSRLEGFGQW